MKFLEKQKKPALDTRNKLWVVDFFLYCGLYAHVVDFTDCHCKNSVLCVSIEHYIRNKLSQARNISSLCTVEKISFFTSYMRHNLGLLFFASSKLQYSWFFGGLMKLQSDESNVCKCIKNCHTVIWKVFNYLVKLTVHMTIVFCCAKLGQSIILNM